LLMIQGDYPAAEILFRRALEAKELALFANEPPLTLTSSAPWGGIGSSAFVIGKFPDVVLPAM